MQKQATNSIFDPIAGRSRRQRVERDAEQEERVVGVLATDIVGQRRPEEPAADIEQREQTGEAGRDCRDGNALLGRQRIELHVRQPDQRAGEDFLQHRRRASARAASASPPPGTPPRGRA
jgi:hypothetical protein